jgi:hypothetical protein
MSHPKLPSPYFKFYASVSSAIIMSIVDPGKTDRGGRGANCCRITTMPSAAGGNIVVRPTWDASGSSDITLVVPANSGAPCCFEIEVERIVSATLTNIVVYWPRIGGE